MPPDAVGAMAGRVQSAWSEAGREGRARIVVLAYFSLGDTEDESIRNVRHYYEPMGTEMAEMIAGSALRTADSIKGAIDAYAQVGIDEFILDPRVSDPGQVDLLAELVF